ncbi:MAG: tetratricopeptide repeat protein [Phycisphaerales bacterium]
MARVNKKLALVVSVAAVVTAGVIGVVVIQKQRNDPTRHVRNGDAAMAAGDYKKAADYYGRAIGKRPSSAELHEKYLGAVTKVVPESSAEANERYRQYLGSLMKRAQILRDEGMWRRVFAEFRQQPELTEDVGSWKGLSDEFDRSMLGTLAPDDKLQPLARLYRSYARSRSLSSLAPEEVDELTTDLSGLITIFEAPADVVNESAAAASIAAARTENLDLAYAALLRIRMAQATTLQNAGQKRQAADAWTAFDALLAKATAAVSDGPEVKEIQFARMTARRAANDPAVTAEALNALGDDIARSALASDDGPRVFRAAKALTPAAGPQNPDRSTQLLTAFIEKHPDAIIERHALATFLLNTNPEKAREQSRAIIEMPRLPVSQASEIQEQLRVVAAQRLLDVEFGRWAEAKPEDRPAAITRLEQAREELYSFAKGLPDDSMMVRADAKIAFAKGNFSEATMKFNELFKRGALVNAELYMLAAAAAEQQNMFGLALQHISSAVDLSPGNTSILERRAILEARAGRLQEADRTLAQLLERDPNSERLKQLRADLQQQIRSAGGIDENSPLVPVLKKAQVLFDKNDLPGTLALLRPLIAEHPDDPQLLFVLARVEAAAGNDAEALKYVEHGLQVAPNDVNLRAILPYVKSNDPIERARAIAEQTYPEGRDRTVFTYVRVAMSADVARLSIEQLKGKNDAEAKRLEDLLPKYAAAEADLRQKALAADPNHPAIQDLDFGRAVTRKDYAAAEQIIAQVEAAKRDAALAYLLRARLAIAQAKYVDAVAVLQQAIQRNVDSGDIYAMLGATQDQTGDSAAALKSYGEAYKREPTRADRAKSYVGALVKSGDRQQALVVLRDARRVAPNDVELREYWLSLENEIGDRAAALAERQRLYRLTPTELRNSLALAQLLAEGSPDRGDVIGETGKVKYNEPQWRALDAATQQRELERVRDDWREQSDKIFGELLRANPNNVELALVRASSYRRQGKIAEAEAVLKKTIDAAGDKATPEMWIALGVNRFEAGDRAGATAAFTEAVNRQDDTKRGADAAVGSYYFQRGQWELATKHLQRVAEKNDSRDLSLQIVEALTKSGKFDDAKAILARVASQGNRDVGVMQLEALLALAQGDALLAKKENAAAIKSYDEALAALKAARDKAPNNPVIPVQQASAYQRQFEASSDRAKLSQAIEAVDQALALRADYLQASLLKSELLIRSADIKGAIAELERFVKAAPSQIDGRRRLVDVLVATQNRSRAREVVRDGITLAPNEPLWYAYLGEIEALNGQFDAAVAAYEQADRVKPSFENLRRSVSLRLQKKDPSWDEVIKKLRDRQDDVRSSPYLQSATAAALYASGDKKRGLDGMRDSYRFAKRLMAQADAGGAEAEALRVNPAAELDGWYANLALIFPAERSADAEKFVNETAEGKLELADLRWLAESWLRKGPDGASRGIELAEKALTVDPEALRKSPAVVARLNDRIGIARFQAGDCKGALVAFARAKDAMPNEPSYLNNFAYACGECGESLPEGIAAAERATQMDSSHADYYDTLGFLLYLAGDKTKAADALNTALRIEPSASANFHLAQVFIDQGRKEDARNCLRAAGDLKPDEALQKKINALIDKLR